MNKIMILANYKAHYKGNFICSILYLSKELKRKRYKTIFIFPEEARYKEWHKEIEAAGKVYYISDNTKIRFKQILQIYHKEKSQIVYAHFGYDNEIAFLSWLYPKVKFFNHSHTDMNANLNMFLRIEQFLKKKLFMHRIHTIVVSKHLKQSKNDVYIPNGLVLDRFDESKLLNRDEIRSEIGIKEDEYFILMFAWNLNIKGVDIACHAFEKLLNYTTRVKLGIVYNRRENIGEVKNQIEQFGISKRTMEYLVLLKQTNNVEKYYISADIFLSSSRSEGFSYSILEALYLGKVVVYSNIAGCLWCEEFLNTYPFKSEDSNNCLKALLHALRSIKNTNYENKILIATNTEIKKNYGIDIWVNRIIEILLK